MMAKTIADKAHEIVLLDLVDAAVALMDDDIREAVHRDLAPCTDEEFLTEYMTRHLAVYGWHFVV